MDSQIGMAAFPNSTDLLACTTGETKREPAEPWSHFIERGALDALAAVERWPTPGDLSPDLPGRILYNLSWVSDADFEKLNMPKS
jgi:hypothetical protein